MVDGRKWGFYFTQTLVRIQWKNSHFFLLWRKISGYGYFLMERRDVVRGGELLRCVWKYVKINFNLKFGSFRKIGFRA